MLLNSGVTALSLRAKLFRGLADSSRLAILDRLRAGPRSVSQIVELTGLSQSNTSNHLACLIDCGLIAREQQGRYVFYRLSDEKIKGLLETADELLAEVARGVYECTHYNAESE